MAREEDDDDGDEHRGDGDVPLLPLGHARPPLVGLVHGAHHHHVEHDHHGAGEEAHEEEVAQQDVVLDVHLILSQGCGLEKV